MYKTALKTNTPEELIEKYAPLVKRIAYHLITRLPSTVQVDDLLQTGLIALIEAAKNFDDSKGASFETYASIRIRGMMLDELRKLDWVPRSVHKNLRMVTRAIREVEARFGRDARDHEIAREMNLSLNDYHKLMQDYNTVQMCGLEEAGLDDDHMFDEQQISVPGPVEGMQRENFANELSAAIAGLPEREALVLSLYYDEELNLKEIGEVLEISESRVCQIHGQAMARLKTKMSAWKET